MPDRSLTVWMGDEVAGELVRRDGGVLRFDYDEAYAARLDATPISTALPPSRGSASDPFLANWLWGLLPDDADLLAQWARRFQTSLGSPFGLLESPVGRDCAGAIRFTTPEAGDHQDDGAVAPLDDTGVADILRDLVADRRAWLPRAEGGEFSLAGAQAKTALHCVDGRWGIPLGSMPSTHILKPAIEGFDDHDLNEHLCMDAARRCGLPCARTTVESFEDQTAIVVTRYDRLRVDGTLRRVHQEDLCQALGRHPKDKYQREGGPTPVEIVSHLRSVMPRSAAHDAVERFVDALIWNWIIVGTDAHAKNYSLLLDADRVRLAPLYDIGSILPYDHAHPRKWKFAMKYGSDYAVVSYAGNPWPKMAAEFGLDRDVLLDRVRDLCERAPDAFNESVAALPDHARSSTMPARLQDAVAARSVDLLAMLDRTRSRD